MQKFVASLAFFVMTNLSSSSQLIAKKPAQNPIRCYTVERINEIKKSKPNIETDVQFENWIGKKIKDRKQSAQQRPLAGNYTIPVVFHIIHNGEAVGTSANLDAAYVQQQLLQLNKDFANVSNSQYSVSTASEIQFVLAQKDPTNNVMAEPGIDRINRNAKSWTDYAVSPWEPTYIDASVKPNSIWNSNNYFNVWVIPNLTIGATSILGYATFPSSSTLTGLNNNETANSTGVVILTATVGSSFYPGKCDYAYGLGKTLAHETGHFLGLRHIWGDSNCGTDFCDDTPTHLEANYGKPAHPKGNTCGTADEMFENYMDYSDDELLNTFTVSQVARMQTVMLNSPRRPSLATSNVGGVVPVGSNQISFTICSGALNISEAGTVGNGPRYRDVNLTLNVDDKATGAAAVNISVTSNAATNFNYQLLTPVLNYAAGDRFKNVRIRIFDNAEVDGPKTLTVSYAISGNGVTAGAGANSVNINISDDDFVVLGNGQVAVYSESFGTTGGLFPSGGWLSGSFKTPAGTNAWVVGGSGGVGVTGQAIYVSNNTASKTLNYALDQASDAVVITPKISTKGYTNATLSFNYKCNGEANGDENKDFGTVMYSFDNATFNTLTDDLGEPYVYVSTPVVTSSGNISLPATLQDTSFTIGFRWQNNDNLGSNPPFLVDDIVVNATPYQVETSVSNSYGFDIQPGAALNNFKSLGNKVIASIKNSSTALSGVSASITQAGNGTVGFRTSQGTYLRTQKVFQISPSVANSTATYQATFYFTAAELAIWGADSLKLKILKVKDGVSLSNTLNFNEAELINPTVLQNIAGGYIAYTANFTGFSQFVLVSPATVLPANNGNFPATDSIKISVGPNPAKDYVNLLISGSANRASIRLLNAAGQKLLQRTDVNTSNGVYKLPLPALSKGIYTIMIYLPEGTFAKKIIIQ